MTTPALIVVCVTNAGASVAALVPRFIRSLQQSFAGLGWEELVWSCSVLALAAIVGRAASWLALGALKEWSKHRKAAPADLVSTELQGPLRWLGPLLAVQQILPLVSLPAELLEDVCQCLIVAVIGAVCWLALRAARVAETLVVRRFDTASAPNLRARVVHTQMSGLRNVVSFLIVVVALAFALLSFDRVRQIGAGLLASAGLAGVVLGFAAQRSLAAVLAGIQIAFTQPIRLDDAVVVEGEFGRIEEITLTYVVVRVWDGRRLVLPIGYFLEKPFQNWTRRETNLLGTVELHLDYTAPVDAVRKELERLLEQSQLWDRKTWGVQVTDAGERTVLVRLLVSAADAGAAFDLRCEMREKVIAFLQREHPGCLPRARIDSCAALGLQAV